MPIWPGSIGFRIRYTRAFGMGDDVNVSQLEMDVHCGTHVESPLHFVDGGSSLEAFALDVFVGAARVVHLPDVESIGPDELEAAVVPARVDRLLLRTRNSDLWASSPDFQTDYVALSVDGARWIAEHGVRLIGVDYLSVQGYRGDPETHRVLMRAGVAILEGIDLSGVESGEYRLTCLPLRLAGAEAAPARAILEGLP
jgi:arylformamidase